ncbi:MAG: DUF799 family lipoprotein [Deltaproteobacteria bacterium]|nr:DUF799 family lipoprotein [Deltaproteobacteria bacterium]
MRIYRLQLYLLTVIILIISGCSTKVPLYPIKPDNDKNQAKVIAVLPVENGAFDGKTSQLLRSRIFEELYFKGYPKLPLDIIDKKLESLHSSNEEKNSSIAPQALKDLVGADAGMYCKLTDDNKPNRFFYGSVTIAISCELRSALTGEILWNAQDKSTSRNFDITSKRLEGKYHEAMENVIEEVVNKVLKTLPDGPNLRG